MKPIHQKTEERDRKIRILSLDGGGIRGIIPAMVLSYMEKQLQEKSGNPDARISDYFDFLAGTSTGGLLVSALLTPDPQNPKRPKLTAQQACDIYLKKGGRIFGRSFFRKIRSLFSMLEERFSAKALEEELRIALGGNTWLSNLLKPCMITAYDIFDRRAIFFTREDAKIDEQQDFKVWEAARATSAAPTYFEPIQMKAKGGSSLTLVDGGVFANNPAMCAYTEVKKMPDFFRNGLPPSIEDMLIVSISTGTEKKSYTYKEMKKRGQLGWIRPIIDIFMEGSTNTADYQLKKLFIEANGEAKENYYRLKTRLVEASHEMDDASRKNLKHLEEAGHRNVEELKDQLDAIVDKLILNHPVSDTEDIELKQAG